MAIQSRMLLDEVVDMIWFCLQQPVYMNGLFSQYFYDLDVVMAAARDANLTFRPYPPEALDCDEPPNTTLFQSRSRGQYAIHSCC